MWGTQTGKKVMNTPEKVFTSMASWQTAPSKITNPQFPVAGSEQPCETRAAGGTQADAKSPRSSA